MTLADSLHVSSEELRKINPHILHWCTHPVKQHVSFTFPRASKRSSLSYAAPPSPTSRCPGRPTGSDLGENLRTVARRFGVPLEALLSLNNFSKNVRLAAGQEISLPLAAAGGGSHGRFIRQAPVRAKHYTEIDVSGLRVIKYKVRSGDCLWGLAQIFRVDKDDLCKWNHLASDKSLRAGMVVTIYKPAGVSAQGPQLAPNPVPRKKQAAPAMITAPKNSALGPSAGDKHTVAEAL